MAAFLPEQVIDQVRQASDIVDILSEFLPLKKRGRNHVCNCPFHHEKTPSFSVSREKQIYYCFGCGKGGNVITFLMEHEQMSFPEAVKFLARRAGIVLPESRQGRRDNEKFSRLYYANEQAAVLYQKSLLGTEAGSKVLGYLHEVRCMTGNTIDEFRIGYAPEGWENLIAYARGKQVTSDELSAAGLVVRRESDSGYYDRFRQRLMFPIFDFSRRVIGFGARALATGETIKYLNSPETPLYSKSRVLYGLSHTRADIRERREALIVEGYMDLLSLYQAGTRNVVAVSGTSFTKEHALLLKRYADTVYLMFDADPAGQGGAERCAEHLFAVGIDVRVVILPEGDDPDSFVRTHGRQRLEEVINDSISYFGFVKASAEPSFEERNLVGQQMLVKSQLRLVSLASDEVARSLMLRELSELYGMTEQSLARAMQTQGGTEKPPPQPRYASIANRQGLERSVLALLVSHPPLLDSASEALKSDWFSRTEYKSIYNLMLILREEGRATDIASLVDKIADDNVLAVLTSLMSNETDPGDWETAFEEYVGRLRTANRDEAIRICARQLQEAEQSGDAEGVKDLRDRINRLRSES